MRKKDNHYQNIESLISQGVEIKGQIYSQGSIRIDGGVEGQLDIKGDLVIGDKGRIKGEIKVDNAILAGKIEGNVQAKGKFEITASGIMNGDVACNLLIIEEGGLLNGSSKMTKPGTENRPGNDDLKKGRKPVLSDFISKGGNSQDV